MTILEMKEKKRELGYTNEMVAKLSGVPLATVQKIFAGVTKSPRRATLLALEKVLRPAWVEPRGTGYPEQIAPSRCSILAEPSSAYGNASAVSYSDANVSSSEKRYTIEDYYALPDERRVELIDGVFYDMASPGAIHQIILFQLGLQLYPCIEQHPECELFLAPLDVCLDNDMWTMVQPDIFITCKKKNIDRRKFNGAPDFVIEILSPSNRFHDLFRKLGKYRLAGVREYWIVDPENHRVAVYDLGHDTLPVHHDFTETIPVLISGGRCSVDFSRILERIKEYE